MMRGIGSVLLGVALMGPLLGCGAKAPVEDETTATWTTADDVPLEEPGPADGVDPAESSGESSVESPGEAPSEASGVER